MAAHALRGALGEALEPVHTAAAVRAAGASTRSALAPSQRARRATNDVDYLTLHTGKKLQTPFDVFVAFSTNLDPAELVDDAFLRRVRYKLAVEPPDDDQFHAIWEVVCRQQHLRYDAAVIDWLIDTHYRPQRREFAACQPRDLVAQIHDIAGYRGEAPALSQELLDAAARNYFVSFEKKPRR